MDTNFSSYMINGEIADQVSVLDRGLHYGDGVFETLVAVNGKLVHWEEHMGRLQTGCERLKIPVQDQGLLYDEVQALLKQNDTTDHVPSGNIRRVVKIIITRGAGKRGYKPSKDPQVTRIVALLPFPDYPDSYYRDGVRITRCNTPVSCNPVLAGIKHLNRLEQIMAQDEWSDDTIFDGIMLNLDKYVIECTMSNIYWVSSEQLMTPDLSNCGVEGIIRAKILQLAEELQLTVKIDYFEMKDLLEADEVMISNSLLGICPVTSIDDEHKIVGPITRKLMQGIA